MKTRISILFVVLAVLALPSFAQYERFRYVEEPADDGGGGGVYDGGDYYTRTFDLGRYMDNPCTAVNDLVRVDYNVYLYQEAIQASLSAGRYIFEEDTTMAGMYATAGSTLSDVGYGKQPFTLRKYHKVNTPDAFHVVTVIDYDPATQQSYISTETACGNGMPDSAQ